MRHTTSQMCPAVKDFLKPFPWNISLKPIFLDQLPELSSWHNFFLERTVYIWGNHPATESVMLTACEFLSVSMESVFTLSPTFLVIVSLFSYPDRHREGNNTDNDFTWISNITIFYFKNINLHGFCKTEGILKKKKGLQWSHWVLNSTDFVIYIEI